MKTKKIALTKLNADPKNANTHNEKNLETIRKNIEEFGVYAPLVVQASTMNVVIGNGRLEVLIAMGRKDADCIVMDLTDAKAKKLAVADNRSSDLSEWDDTILAEILIEMGEEDAQDVGFTADDLADLLPDEPAPPEPDAVPTPPKKAITKPGMVYRLGKHRLMCGDSTDQGAVATLMDGEKADMLFTDPPYGVDYDGGHNKKKRSGIIADELKGENLTGLFYGALLLAVEFTKDTAAFYVWFASGKSIETFASLARLPLELRAVIQWYKVSSGLGAFMSQYIPNCEPCMYLFKTGKSPKWYGPTDEKTVWELKKETVNEFHPTQKPVQLGCRAISNSSKKKDIILDLFGGSGSTLIACEQTSRRCRMMELDPIFCDVIVQRYCNLKGIDSEKVFKTGIAE